MPRRLPSPSSPTAATNRMVRSGFSLASRRARASATNAASPVPLSEIPGPMNRLPSRFTFTTVSGGKTVSRCAVSITTSFSFDPGSSPMMFPDLSALTRSPADARSFLKYAPRAASWKGGAGMAVMRACSSLIAPTFFSNQASARAACRSREIWEALRSCPRGAVRAVRPAISNRI